MSTDTHLASRIGSVLRSARLGRQMTLRALSQKSGLSEAFLSRLERGQVSTSIANLIAITGIIGVGLADLFEANGAAGGARGYVIARAGERRPPQEIAASGYRYQPLVTGWHGQRLDAFILTFPRRNRADVMTAHEGEELVYVLEGRILFQLGEERIPLGVGDSIYFKADIAHMGKNVGEVDARVLMVTTPGRGPGREFGWWKTPVVGRARSRRPRSRKRPATDR